ncbi:5-formyltetrahydrofolate cyclo-ligase [Spirosoma sp. SC4-14]|uniref:5-formyltetrahydrofolate cyclo-ligase n=1 Tax=Spirosoma sp. SC4-14 TaxID=3128900 RepID=UPI0030CCD066
MKKAELRRQFRQLRKSLPTEEIDIRSRQIAQRFFEQQCTIGNSTIHLFLPILRQHEIDTWPIIDQLWRNFPDVRVAISVTDSETYRLSHYQLTPDTVLAQNRWGIPEPIGQSSIPIQTSTLDLVLVPLLIFDQQGHRVGYGGGFYDRFLADCRPDCLKIGLSLFEPIDKITDVEPTDVPLDVCITPQHTYRFSKE